MKSTTFIKIPLLLAILLGSAFSGVAAPIPVTNPGFESDVQADGAATVAITGWTKTGVAADSGTFNPDALNPPLPTEGSNLGFMNLNGTAATSIGIFQTVQLSLAANTIYTVTFDVGNREGLTTRDGDSTIRGFFTLGGDGTNFGSAVGLPFTMVLASIPDGTFLTDQTFTFSTVGFGGSLAQSLNIAFLFDRPAGLANVNQVSLDNIRATSTLVPEPSSILLAALGGGLLLYRLRRRE